jgi:iron complex transport system ATP-binding protein
LSAHAVAAAAPAAVLRVEALPLVAGAKVLVARLGFEVQAGEIWALVGPNGVGKSTLLAALAGLAPSPPGAISMGGRALASWSLSERARYRAYLPQVTVDAFGATVLDAVLVGRHPHQSRWHWENDGDRARARGALAAMDLAGMEDRDVLSLSGGERRRVALAACLAQDPQLLLLDEPLAHLDVRHAHAAMAQLGALARSRGCGVVFSVHDLNLAMRYATHAVLFTGAAQAAVGPVSRVLGAEVLSVAFGHPIARIGQGDDVYFVER